MSANQIPSFRLKADDEWNTKPRPHSCVRCWMNGGEGHTPAEKRLIGAADSMAPSSIRRTLPAWAKSAKTATK